MNWLITLLAALCLLATPIAQQAAVAQFDDPPERVAVPTLADRKKADAKVNDVFTEEIASAKSSAAKRALAETLLDVVEQEDDVTVRFALLNKARQLAIAAGDVDVALKAATQLVVRYKTDELVVKSSTLIDVSKKVDSKESHATLITTASGLAEFAASQQKFQKALQLTDIAIASAREAVQTDTERALKKRRRDVDRQRREFDEVKVWMAKLENDPTDPEANLNCGRYYCFVVGNWELGISMLALGSDPDLRKVAGLEVDEEKPPVEVGDAWWQLAESAGESSEGEALRTRAIHWYREALPELEGLERARIEKRVPEDAPVDEDQDSPSRQGDIAKLAVRRNLVSYVIRSVRAKNTAESDEAYGHPNAVGGNSKQFSVQGRGYLVGLDVAFDDRSRMVGIQPYFRTSGSIKPGKLVGRRTTNMNVFRPKGKWFAIGTINVAVDEDDRFIHGIEVEYMEILDEGLNTSRSVKSIHFAGRQRSEIVTIGGDGKPIYGIYGHAIYFHVSGLGVLQTK